MSIFDRFRRKRHLVTIVGDSNFGGSAIYLDGQRVADAGDEDVAGTISTYWSDALEDLLPRLGVDVDFLSALQPSHRVGGYFEPAEFEGYWPERLEELVPNQPYDADDDAPLTLVVPDGPDGEAE